MPLTAPTILNRIPITPADAQAAQTLTARRLRLLILMGRSKNSEEWQRFQKDAPPFVVTGLEELMTAWLKLESGQIP